MPKLIVGRHTETIFNNKNIFSGCIDVPLSNKGIQQAVDMAKAIANEKIDIVFVSSLMRTKETAALLMQAYYNASNCKFPIFVESATLNYDEYIPILSDRRIDERSYGILEGCSKQQVEEQYGQQKLFSWRRSWWGTPKNGESLCSVCNRVKCFLNDSIIPLLNIDKSVLIICHQNSMRAIKIIVDNIEESQVEQIEFKNGQIIKYEYTKGIFVSEL